MFVCILQALCPSLNILNVKLFALTLAFSSLSIQHLLIPPAFSDKTWPFPLNVSQLALHVSLFFLAFHLVFLLHTVLIACNSFMVVFLSKENFQLQKMTFIDKNKVTVFIPWLEGTKNSKQDQKNPKNYLCSFV